jgi:Zn-dependent protease with chaperone function/tellurite resistance protein
MDFFNQQAHARKSTTFLVILYLGALTAIIGSVYFVLMGLYVGVVNSQRQYAFQVTPPLWNLQVFTFITAVTACLVCGGTLMKFLELRGGGARVAEQLDGRRIPPDSSRADEKKVLNVVEEMSIASGLPVPPVYLLPYDGINAFAAGLRTDQAIIAVTQGAIANLSRDELQGVIAHEFSHILNGDMRLNLRLIALLNGILVLAISGRVIARAAMDGGRMGRGRQQNGAVAVASAGVAIVILGYVGVFFARIIQSAVSRQREFLADASAVQFTRNPLGIGGALRKILGAASGSRIAHPHAEGASHLFFANGLRERWISLFATHPPLKERIRRIEGRVSEFTESEPSSADDSAPQGTAGFAGVSAAPAAAAVTARQAVAAVGTLGTAHIDAARAILGSIPIVAQNAARDAYHARLLIFALLLDPSDDVQERQMELLAKRLDENELSELTRLSSPLENLTDANRLALVDLCMPALKGLSTAQYAQFRDISQSLMQADGVCSVFEYTLLWVVLRRLDASWGVSRRKAPLLTAQQARAHAAKLVSALAALTQDSPQQAALAAGAALRELAYVEAPPAIARDAAMQEMENALVALQGSRREDRAVILSACAAVASSDGRLTQDEADLVRAIAEALQCPMPPFPALSTA